MRTVVSLLFLLNLLGIVTAAGSLSPTAAKPASQNTEYAPGADSILLRTNLQYSDLAVKWLREYLRINTTNPPGNEGAAADFFRKIFDAEGIENQVLEFAPGRANIWARVPCNTAPPDCDRPLILLNHMDVVTADPSRWRVPPFSAAVLNGSIYGRGAQDMKTDGLAQAIVLVMLQRERAQLHRDVIFLATGDEEVDDAGSKWIIQNRRDLLGNAEFLITEGGENYAPGGAVEYVGIDIAEKAPFWLHVVAHGRAGHGSQPTPDAAPARLIAALQRITAYQPEMKLTPVVEEYFRAMASLEPGGRAQQFMQIRHELQRGAAREEIRSDQSIDYMLQDTLAVTMFGGSEQTNVIPGEAWANVDARLLPGTDPQQFLDELRRVVNDPSVTVEPMKPFSPANASPPNTALWKSIQSVSRKYFGDAPLIPYMISGYTESQMYRQLGIVCYGFSPYAENAGESGTEHGDNERISIDEVRQAPHVLYDLVLHVAGAPPNH